MDDIVGDHNVICPLAHFARSYAQRHALKANMGGAGFSQMNNAGNSQGKMFVRVCVALLWSSRGAVLWCISLVSV